MKANRLHTFATAAVILAVAVAFASCQMEELPSCNDERSKGSGLFLTFCADTAVATRTEWNGATVIWSAGDQISVAYEVNGAWSENIYDSEPLGESVAKARFSVQTDLEGTEKGSLRFYGIYPSSAVSSDFSEVPVVTVTVPSAQKVSGATYDSRADIMLAESYYEYEKVPDSSVPMLWNRLVAHADITLSNISLSDGETLDMVMLTADDNAVMTGDFTVNLLSGECEAIVSSLPSNRVSIDVSSLAVDESGNLNVWAAFMPCVSESLTVELMTSRGRYIRNINSCALDFMANTHNVLQIDMSSGFVEKIDTEAFELLDLDYPGLEMVKSHYLAEDYNSAAIALVDYFRNRSVVNPEEVLSERKMYSEDKRIAEQALEHRFCVRNGYWYESVDGNAYTYYDFDNEDGEIDWNTELPGAGQESYQRHWHQWFKYLSWAQYLTGDDKYFNCWKEVYADWLETFPAPEKNVDLSAFQSGSWHQLSVATRISNQLAEFPYFITSNAFSGSWMTTFLVEFHRMVEFSRSHLYYEGTSNIRFAQYTAQANASMLFPEFRLAQEWLAEVAPKISGQFTLQFYDDGVHTEMTPNYQLGVMDNFRSIYNIAQANGREDAFDPEYVEKMRSAALFLANYVWPDYTWELFNDTFQQTKNVLLRNIKHYSSMFPDENVLKYLASERRDGAVPTESLISFPVGGYYILRTGWNGKESMFILKNNYNPANEYHCHMDNGTFALWSKGRNFLPDAGVYTYGGTTELDVKRKEYIATASHNTLTKNLQTIAKNYSKGRCLLTRTSEAEDLVVTQNASYSDLTHRRAVYMLDKEFYVIVDEAFGSATACDVNLSFHLCEGTVVTDDSSTECAYGVHTEFPDGNDMLLRTFSETASGFNAETGISHCSTKMNTYYDRTYYRVTVDKAAAADVSRFITVIYPARTAEISATFTSDFDESSSSVKVTVNGKEYDLSYTLP